jgi:hypothetical protein
MGVKLGLRWHTRALVGERSDGRPHRRDLRGVGLAAGDRVIIVAWFNRGRTGTLVRPAWFLFKRAWLVDLDGGSKWTMRRTRVAEVALMRLGGADHPGSTESTPPSNWCGSLARTRPTGAHTPGISARSPAWCESAWQDCLHIATATWKQGLDVEHGGARVSRCGDQRLSDAPS